MMRCDDLNSHSDPIRLKMTVQASLICFTDQNENKRVPG